MLRRQVRTALVVQKTVEIPQLQFLAFVVVPLLCAAGAAPVVLWRHCDHAAYSSSPSRTFLARFSSDRQFLYKVVDTVAYDSCPRFRLC